MADISKLSFSHTHTHTHTHVRPGMAEGHLKMDTRLTMWAGVESGRSQSGRIMECVIVVQDTLHEIEDAIVSVFFSQMFLRGAQK